ncbi:MAG TPA: protein translocase subunit SecF [Acidimicrobiia bacterium]|nr:protein translocase subunit SecF [Acidimicrobiia bacterium]
MTVIAPPAGDFEDIPGVTRRHKLSDLYHERTNFQFIKHSRRWLIISSTLVVMSLVLLGVRGLNLGIDFEGGTAWVVQMQGGKSAKVADVRTQLDKVGFRDAKVSVLTPPGGGADTVRVEARVVNDPIATVQSVLAKYGGVTDADVQVPSGAGGSFTFSAKAGITPTVTGVKSAIGTRLTNPQVKITGRTVTVTVAKLPASPVQSVAAVLQAYSGAKSVNDVSITTVGPTWGHEVSQKALKALIIFFFVLAAYLALRFEWKMSAAAIIAVIHDIIFTVGVYALFHFPVSPATVTAFLTILGFSLYDTVVVFDKVTEFQRTLTATGRSTYSEMVNKSLNAVLMRSVSTSLVALLPVVSLLVVGSVILGATALEDFALALAAGLFIGSYSSIFVAAPLLAWWKEREPQYRSLAERRRRAPGTPAPARLAADACAVDGGEFVERAPLGVPGPPAVPRVTIQARPRQQRGKKRK